MSCATNVNLLDIRNINLNVSYHIEVEDQPYITPGYQVTKGIIIIHEPIKEVISYYRSNINLKENLDYYTSIGLRDMVESETTHLSMEYSENSVNIMKSIVEEFGGWIDENDQDDSEYYKVDRRIN